MGDEKGAAKRPTKNDNGADIDVDDVIEGGAPAVDISNDWWLDQVWQEFSSLSVGIAAMVVSSWSNQSLTQLFGRVIDQSTTTNGGGGSGNNNSNNENSSLASATIYKSLAWVVLGGGLASLLRTSLLTRAQQKIQARLRHQAMQVLLLERDLQWFHSITATATTTASTTARTTNDDNSTNELSLSKEEVQVNHQERSYTLHDNKEEGSFDFNGNSGITTAISITPATIGTILDRDVEQMAATLTTSMINLLRGFSTVAYSTYQMLTLDPALFGVSVSLVPLIGAASMLIRKRLKRLKEEQLSLQSKTASFVQERLLNISMVKLSNRQLDELQAFDKMQSQALELGRRLAVWEGTMMGFLFAASAGALFCVVRQGKLSVQQGKMTSGQLSSFASFSFLLGLGTSGVVRGISEVSQGWVSAERYQTVFGSNSRGDGNKLRRTPKPTTVDATNSTSKLASSSSSSNVNVDDIASIRLENVNFAYQLSTADGVAPVDAIKVKPVLHDISFELQRGKVTALVGMNGSGKTTLASVLAGLYPPTSGQVVLVSKAGGSTPVVNKDGDSSHQWVHMLSQTTALFDTTIFENVKYSRPDATLEEVQEALHQAHCTGFIQKLESHKEGGEGYGNGLNFRVGWNGTKLSGGQRQRLALARALLADPVLLIMDEPSTSLDAQGQSAVANVVHACRNSNVDENKKKKSRALLLIVHQASSLQWADEILVLQEGRIVERGTLSELCSTDNSRLIQIMPELQVVKSGARR